MKHIIFGIMIAAYSLGILNLVFLGIVYRRSRAAFLLWTIRFIGSLTGVLIVMAVFSYLEGVSDPGNGEALARIGSFLVAFFSAPMIFIVPGFTHSMFAPGYRSKMTRLLSYYSFGLLILLGTAFVLSEQLNRIVQYLIGGSLSGAILYSIITGVKGAATDRKRDSYKRIAAKMALLTFFFLPGFIVFDFFYYWFTPLHGTVLDYVSVVPFFYLTWNIFLFIEHLRGFGHYPVEDTETLFAKSGLTEREKEVGRLLVQGRSYADIQTLLFISKATVKTHTNRIYRKTNTRNQADLIARTSRKHDASLSAAEDSGETGE